jgi:nucleoside 2-deoxyribosyltransferase
MNIYVASSWRNDTQQAVCRLLRAAGHDVYDFQNPAPGNTGFAWADINPNWRAWSFNQFCASLRHPIAADAFRFDRDALRACDACVLVLLCGRSAHLELGYAVGAGKATYVYAPVDMRPHLASTFEAELMYLLCDRVLSTGGELLDTLQRTTSQANARLDSADLYPGSEARSA